MVDRQAIVAILKHDAVCRDFIPRDIDTNNSFEPIIIANDKLIRYLTVGANHIYYHDHSSAPKRNIIMTKLLILLFIQACQKKMALDV